MIWRFEHLSLRPTLSSICFFPHLYLSSLLLMSASAGSPQSCFSNNNFTEHTHTSVVLTVLEIVGMLMQFGMNGIFYTTLNPVVLNRAYTYHLGVRGTKAGGTKHQSLQGCTLWKFKPDFIEHSS